MSIEASAAPSSRAVGPTSWRTQSATASAIGQRIIAGGTTATRDLSVIVTASEQADYFRVLLKAMELVLPEVAAKTRHVPRVLATYRLDQSAKSNAEESAAAVAAAHLVQQRNRNQRFASVGLNGAWHRAWFYGSFFVRAWVVVRDNPLHYVKTITAMFPGRRLWRLFLARMRAPF